MKDFVAFMAKGLVADADQVVVTEVRGDTATVIELEVAESDLGKVIGKKGRTAKALRSLIQASAAKSRTRVILEILD